MDKALLSKTLKAMHNDRVLAEAESSRNRARAVSVGTSFGGVSEVTMRTDDGRTVWAHMQPVEIVELIHQLAANVGCHIQIIPRNDFSSWRNWRTTEAETKKLNGWPAFVNDMEPHMSVGTNRFSIEDQRRADSFFPPEMGQNEREKELSNAVATQKDLDQRAIEQSPTST